MRPGLRLRPAIASDLLACERVWREAINAYTVPQGQPPVPEDNPGLRRLHAHALATDPSRFWVATEGEDASGEDGDVVAFGSAVQRERLWFLSMLFVLPAFQGAGLGRALLDRIGPDAEGVAGAAAGGEAVRGTATDSAQPISNALYASMGIVPRTPLWRLVGEWRGTEALPPLPDGVVASPLEAGRIATADIADVDALDRATLGVAHGADRDFLAADGRRAYGYRDGGGRLVAYGWAGEAGRIGPVAATDPGLLAPVVGHLVGAIPSRGAVATWVAGEAGATMTALLRAGWHLEGPPILLCWDRPFADLSRYLPISPGLL